MHCNNILIIVEDVRLVHIVKVLLGGDDAHTPGSNFTLTLFYFIYINQIFKVKKKLLGIKL